MGFREVGRPKYPEKNPRRREPTTNSTHTKPGRNHTRTTLVGGERSHHYAIPALVIQQSEIHKPLDLPSSCYTKEEWFPD